MKRSTLLAALALLAGLTGSAHSAPLPPGPPIEGKFLLVYSTAGTGGAGAGGFGRGDRTTPASAGVTTKRDALITRNQIQIDGRVPTLEYDLDAAATPMKIDLTLTSVRGKATKHQGIAELKGDRLMIAYGEAGADRPKTFDDPAAGFYLFQKAPPPARLEYRIVTVGAGSEEAAQKELNRLAAEGFEVQFATGGTRSEASSTGGASQNAVTTYLLKRLKP